ncbi:MAG: Glycogen phosphorylase [Steroidobacteraceae bacterium]|nr:Glycogen phosphorylase [Steroidobacteraceae bacterium]
MLLDSVSGRWQPPHFKPVITVETMSTPIFVEITPNIPEKLQRLPELAGNLFFSWDRPCRSLFEDLDEVLWRQTDGNPKLMLRCVAQRALDRAAADPVYLARYAQVLASFDSYLAAPAAPDDAPLVAYFCAEYGFHESFPIYSGGLGVLAGDHCKAASDERLNFVAVGLMYGQGYFVQSVDSDGVQHAVYEDHDPRDLPVKPVRDAANAWLHIALDIAGHTVQARIWRAEVGRVPVLLLDTNCECNAPEDREITHRLYGGDKATRIRQEMVLGIGGVRALRALGLAPAVWHINEGHAAFLVLERVRELVAQGVDAEAALEAVAAECVFTTHTPVAAGHDSFPHDLVRQQFAVYLDSLGLPADRVLALGSAPSAPHEFNMTWLALAGSRSVNGVSREHGGVSAALCAAHWPELTPVRNPVGFVTNGVHVPTFLHQKWAEFFDERLPAGWVDRLSDGEMWKALERVPDEEFWAVSQDVKARMIYGVRARLKAEFAAKGMSSMQWRQTVRFLDPNRPDVLTIGFARRFATYKRASLLMRDRSRLAQLLGDADRPVVFLFAGKAHPADEPGKALVREIKQLMLTPEFAGRVVFLDDYDIRLARWLVSGCDVWLNNPIAPLEASGTSGIKAAVNGSLNLSILDGWWAEACDGANGWGLSPASVQDPQRRDALEAASIMETLEEEVIPLYYAREGMPWSPGWVERCKHAMATVIPGFNMSRVVNDYAEGIYRPAAKRGATLAANHFAGAAALVEFKRRVRDAWPHVTLAKAVDLPPQVARVGRLQMQVAVGLAGLRPGEVRVEIVGERRLPHPLPDGPFLSSFRPHRRDGDWRADFAAGGERRPDGTCLYTLDVPAPSSGQYALEVLATPTHPLLSHPYELGLMKHLE